MQHAVPLKHPTGNRVKHVRQCHHSQWKKSGSSRGSAWLEHDNVMRTQDAFLELEDLQVSSHHIFPDILAVSDLSSRLRLRAGLLAG
jgi:hypothetical protein